MQAVDPYAYWAFVSYSHHDSSSARRLQRALESYYLPRPLVGKHSLFGPMPKRLFPIFRDQDELSSGPSLSERIEHALRVSRTLIVVCSPAARASIWVEREIEYFAKIGRASRIFAVLAEGEPGQAFPPKLVEVCGEPLAADIRSGTRAARRDALLRLVSGIFDLSYDEFARRDAQRMRRRRRIATAAFAAGVVAGAAGYVALADDRYSVPEAAAIRAQLDARDLSVFRHVPSDPELAASMLDTDGRLLDRLDEAARSTKFTFGSPNAKLMTRDQWTSSQGAAGVFAGGFETPEETADLVKTLELGFAPGAIAMQRGKPYGWLDLVSDSTQTEPQTSGERVAWTILALSEALHYATLEPEARARLVRDRDVAIGILGRYGQQADGSWSERPDLRKANYSTYTSVVVYMALLASREGSLPWSGSAAARERAIARVRAFLLTTSGRGTAKGWLTDLGWGYTDSHFEGLDTQVLAALLRDERDGGPPLPPAIVALAARLDPTFETRPFSTDYDTSSTLDEFVTYDGVTMTLSDTVQFGRYPWALAFAAEWYARERRSPGIAHATLVEARRVLANLAVTDAPALLADSATSTSWWTTAEAAYALGTGIRAIAPPT